MKPAEAEPDIAPLLALRPECDDLYSRLIGTRWPEEYGDESLNCHPRTL